ncbi:MAG TPA: GAF domain-containing protein, partial [Ardenticatenaceae bacterium]|nr:GAF domain-containing protein [Ardenticatenaceae bacterium]
MRRWIVSLLILGIGLAILLDLDSQAREVQTSLNEHELRSTAVTLRARLETTLVDRLQPVDAMRAFMEARPNASAVEFYSFARDLYDPLGPMRVAYWVDAESQVRYLYPTFQLDALVANPPLLREDPVLDEAIQQAGERRARVVTDPVQTPPELRAGLGVYVIDPAFVDERLIGFIVGVYYSDRLVRNALTGTPQDDFLVRVRGSQGQLIYGRAEFPGRSDEAPIAVSNGQWHVAVGWREAPAPIDPRTRLLLWSLGGLVIAGALTMFNREITQNMRLASRLAESQALQSTAASLVENLSREEALQLIVEQASQLTGVEGCALLLPAAPDYDLQGTAPCVPSENEVDDCEYLAVAVALGSAAPLMGLAIPVDRSVVGRAFLTGRPQVVNSPGPGDVYQGEEMGVRAILAAPLMIKGRTIGAISLINKRKGDFGESDVRLLTAFANQAAAAIENARLFEAEQHRRQIADRLREATAVVGSDLALNRVLERILDGLGTVVPNTSASVLFLEPGGQWISIIATRGFDLGVIGQRFPTNRPSPSTMVINEGRAVAIRDMPNEWPSFRVFGYQIHSWLGVPLKAKGRVIGMITLDREEVNAFSEEEIALASAFADHAAVAIENARLFEQGNRQVQELQALYETSLQLNLSLDLQALFERS